MRSTLLVLALAALALAQGSDKDKEEKNPFRGKTRAAKGPEDRIRVTVPETWRDAEIAGNMVLRCIAPGAYGGHDLRIDREEGQSDVDKQRDRYMEYDSGNAPEGTVQKLGKPFFGYRINDPARNRVLVRAFVSDGADGLIISVASRFQHYDRLWQEQVYAVVASVSVSGKSAGGKPELAGEMRRLYDKQARVSLVVPSAWKPLTPDEDKDLIFVALKGAKKGPRFVVRHIGERLNAGLALLKISGQWKKTYGNITVRRLGNDPPRMMVKNRIPGSVDYLIAFEHGGHGYALMLTVREGSFERFRALADDVAETVVFSGGAYAPPEPQEREIKEEYKNIAVVHASVEQTGTVDAVIKALGPWAKHWAKIGVGYDKKAPPLQVVVTSEEDFAKDSHYFGSPPVTYDRVARVVVAAPRPKDEVMLASWRGRLFSALTENALHRDIQVTVPVWLRSGLASCMETAGRTGKSPEEAHPAYVERLVIKTSTDAHQPLREILAMTEADVLMAESPNMVVHAWGYVHLMLFGKGSLPGMYRKWSKALVKARGYTPEFDLKKYEDDRKDLKKHVFKRWEKK